MGRLNTAGLVSLHLTDGNPIDCLLQMFSRNSVANPHINFKEFWPDLPYPFQSTDLIPGSPPASGPTYLGYAFKVCAPAHVASLGSLYTSGLAAYTSSDRWSRGYSQLQTNLWLGTN